MPDAIDGVQLPPYDPEVHAGTPKDVEGVIGNVLLTLPFYKHIFAWMGAHPAGTIPHKLPSFTDQAFKTTAIPRTALTFKAENLA